MKIMLGLVLLAFGASSISAQACADSAKEIAPVLSAETKADYEKKLEEARIIALTVPNGGDVDSTIWHGRRTAYTGRYKGAIAIFTKAIARWPEDARLYRHRGHRYVSLRCFDDAIKDFEKAAKLVKGKPDEVEPDGLPNARNVPTSTLQSNIFYHLGLAYYLKGDFKKALKAYESAQKVSTNNDMRVATSYWHYMTLRRLGRAKDAEAILKPFAGEVEIIENRDYLNLIKLNRGEVTADALLSEIGGNADTLGSASLGYGIGNYFLYTGNREKAMEIFRKITAGNQWASFGFIAAEAELARR